MSSLPCWVKLRKKYAIGSMNNWKVPARMSAGIPAAALANRPDVKQAETQLAVAYYATNESRAAFYPGLNLSGAIGWTNDLGTLPVNPGKWIWNAMASLTQPIFQNGKLRAQYKISKSTAGTGQAFIPTNLIGCRNGSQCSLDQNTGHRRKKTVCTPNRLLLWKRL